MSTSSDATAHGCLLLSDVVDAWSLAQWLAWQLHGLMHGHQLDKLHDNCMLVFIAVRI